MSVRSFVAYLRMLGWKVWMLAAVTTLAIIVLCGWAMGGLILSVALLALLPAIRIGMQAEIKKNRRAEDCKAH